ncbi:MAG TPA: hypothetical protein PLH02_03530 [Bacillota bacterium]|nr:hypothetical protein [Bacillota bacterium]HPF42844.1 hypothetical protein [Bacillota bacterium]HPJ85456.1 hypothetical protein [Bacillota bacterium]HPQ61922.1 hypothetical protein [Bacillota bacterium]HRX92222.1 hypothetical protein [Candidatus Izemoplasmatales bacterium]
MWNRLLILTLMQLSNKMNLRFIHNRRFAGKVAVGFVLLVVLSVVMAGLLYLVKNILYIPVNVYFVIFFLIITQVISIISATNGLIIDLYSSKENQILLAFPVKNDEVFVSKLMVYFFHELIKNFYFLIPLLIGFGYVNSMPWWYYLNILPVSIMLPMVAVLTSALLSIPIMYIKHFFSAKNAFSLIAAILMIGGLFYFVTVLVANIPIPIRIVQLYNRFVSNLAIFMQSSAKYGTIYTMIGKLLFNMNMLINYGLVLGIIGGMLLLVFLISRPLYFRLASKTLEFAVDKQHKSHEEKTSKSIFLTFLRKEWLVTKRSVNELLGNYALLFLFPFVLYILNYIYLGIPRSSLGTALMVAFDLLISLFLVSASNTASASAITSEGYEFILLKTAPSKTNRIVWAKITINVVFSSLIIIISFLMFRFALPNFPVSDILPMMVTILILNTTHILWSLQIDVLNPHLAEYASSGSLSGNPNVQKSVTMGFGMSLVFGVIFIALCFVLPDKAWLIIISLSVVFFAYRLFSFINFLGAYFGDIEF